MEWNGDGDGDGTGEKKMRVPAGGGERNISAAPWRESKTNRNLEWNSVDRLYEEEESSAFREDEESGAMCGSVASPEWRLYLCSRVHKWPQRHRPRPCPVPQSDIIGRLVVTLIDQKSHPISNYS